MPEVTSHDGDIWDPLNCKWFTKQEYEAINPRSSDMADYKRERAEAFAKNTSGEAFTGTGDEKPVVGGSEYRYMDARGKLFSQNDPAVLKRWALMDELRDPEMAKAIAVFCKNLDDELDDAFLTPALRVQIITAALGTMGVSPLVPARV